MLYPVLPSLGDRGGRVGILDWGGSSPSVLTLAAECQAPNSLIGPRNKKPRKNGRPLKFLLQAGSSNDDNHTKIYLIRAIMRPRPTAACSGQFAVRQKAVVKRVGEGEVEHKSLSNKYHQKCRLVFWNSGRRISKGDLFSLRWPIRESGAWHSAARAFCGSFLVESRVKSGFRHHMI
jgi:hypothetical protein